MVTGLARVSFVFAASLSAPTFTGWAVVAASGSDTTPRACITGRAYLREGEVEKALQTYLNALTQTSSQCIDRGLRAVANAKHREQRYCENGDALAQEDKSDEAERQYAHAIQVNVTSQCAREGLAMQSGSPSATRRFVDYLPKFPIQLGSLILMLAVGVAIIALIRSVVLRKATLVVRPFADGALDKKVGSAFSGLVEEQLIGFWRTRQQARDDGYNLDLVVANVELLAQDEALGDALGELAQVPQFGAVAAIVRFVDRAFLQRRLSRHRRAPA
jgi:hypothetical protein